MNKSIFQQNSIYKQVNFYLLEIIKVQDQLTSLGGERRRKGAIKLQQMKNS
jgi:hypothetical protein